MGLVKDGTDTVQCDSHSRSCPFADLRTAGQREDLNVGPRNGRSDGIRKDGFQDSSMVTV
jgi:hypothetical protein